VLKRQLISINNKKAVLSLFATFRLSRDALEASNKGIANKEFPLKDKDSNEEDYTLKRR
jgi:hypothetical protein